MLNLSRLHLRVLSFCAHLFALATRNSRTVTSDKWLVVNAAIQHNVPHYGTNKSLLTPLHLALATVLVALATLHSPLATAQTGLASISGRVADHSGAVIQKADVTLKNLSTGVVLASQTNNDGIYNFPSVVPGNYVMRVQKEGFRSVDVTGLTLYTQDQLARNFSLEVGSASESVTVTAAGTTKDSPAVSMTVDREFVEDTPLNGRSFQDLIQLAPGTVSTETGYYVVDGQRSDSNNFTVDGVSANTGGILNESNYVSPGSGLSGSSPMQTILGTTQSLTSIDSLQEFTIQTSGYTADYGRNPGGQIQFTTRSGTNDLHGTAFDYLRNTDFDANSLENRVNNDKQSAEHQNDFGSTFSGPIVIPRLYDGRNQSFFFFSYEGLRLILPTTETEYVPTQALRTYAASGVQPILNTSPLPNGAATSDGCTIPTASGGTTACDALFSESYSYPSRLNNTSIRIDQNIGSRLHAFLRYADTPSSETTGLETVANEEFNAHTWTAGLTANLSRSVVGDLRFNFSRDGEGTFETQRAEDGSVPLSPSLLIPAAYDNQYAYGWGYVDVAGTDLEANSSFLGAGSVLRQYQTVGSISWNRGLHTYKFGADWRRISSFVEYAPYTDAVEILSLAAIQQGYATEQYVDADSPGAPVFDNLSLYAQDHYKLRPSLSIDYGVRWEFNPPPGPSNGKYPVALTSSELTTATLAPLGTPPYKTYYDHFAPRVGFAWNAIPSLAHAITVRGGFGIFFNTGQQSIGFAYDQSYPFEASGPTLSNVPLPLSAAVMQPPSLNFPITPPYPTLFGIQSPDLTMPYTEQWNLSIDEALSRKNTLTVSYVGNEGKKLLFEDTYEKVPGNSNFKLLEYTNNASSSNYNALQVQDVGRITAGLDVVGSFTWAHALDNASSDLSGFAPVYGNSNYDLRRVLNLALNYRIPSGLETSFFHALTSGWTLDNRFAAQSGYPITGLYQAEVTLPDENREYYYPNLVPGVPIYLHGKAADAPDGWRLNRAAFSCTPTSSTTACVGTPTEQGDLGRNYVRDPSFWVLNTAVQRSFPIYEEVHLNFRLDAFNIFNHPNQTAPITTLSNSEFGELIYGDVTTIGSNNALYAMGAARSLQFSLHLQF